MIAPSPKRRGFSLIEVLIAIAIMAILLAIAVPNWVTARDRGNARACQKQLRLIQSAKEQYVMSRNLGNSVTINLSDLVSDNLVPASIVCPNGYSYTIGALNTDPTCGSGLSDHVLDP